MKQGLAFASPLGFICLLEASPSAHVPKVVREGDRKALPAPFA